MEQQKFFIVNILPARLVSLLFCLTTPLSFFMPRCSAWIFVVISLIGWCNDTAQCKNYLESLISKSLMALCCWFLMSSFWSVTPQITFLTSLATAMIVVLAPGFGAVAREIYEDKSFKKLFLISLGITCIFIIGESVLQHPLLAWKKSSSARVFTPVALLLCLNIPLVSVLFSNEKIRIPLFVLILITLRQIDNDTALIGAILSVLTLRIPKVLFSKIRIFGLISIVTTALALPFVMNSWLTTDNISKLNQSFFHDFSYTHRLYIWQVVSKKVLDAPFWGYGFNTSRSQELGGDKKSMVVKHYTSDGKLLQRDSTFIPMHPHNVFLQVWLEGGVVAIGVFIAVFCLILLQIHGVASLVFVGLTVFVMSINVGAWQSWWLTSIVMWGWMINRIGAQQEQKSYFTTS